MSTTIHRENYPVTNGSETKKELSVVRFVMPQKSECKCGYQINVGSEQITLDAFKMKEFVDNLKTYFYAEGYP